MGDPNYGAGVKGALSGGALGFSVGGPVGAGIGAGLGGLYGLFGEDDSASNKPKLGPDPWASHYKSLIDQLQRQASGGGPSLARQQYAAANQNAIANQLALSHGRNAGSARQGAIGAAQLGQGLSAGMAEAGTRERMMAQQQMLQAIQAASNSQNARDTGQLQADTTSRNDPTEMERNVGMAGQVLSAYELSQQRQRQQALLDAAAKAKGAGAGA